jgi:protein-L-isoaspartate O-methyltransferase
MSDWPRADDTEGIAALRDVLRRAGFDAERIQEAVGERSGFVRDPADVPLYVRRLDPQAPLSTLIKLFLLDVSVPREEVETAVAPLAVERLERMGVLRAEGDGLAATLTLLPSGELLIASDQYRGNGAPRPDHVLGLSVSTRVLAALTVRRPVESALDVGTGSGVHALTVAQHAGRVVAVDINPRALRFAEFNAALNGVENVEFREGSVFDPVEGERFDLIVSNPPYVVSPDAEFAYRDSGLPGDSFSEGLVRRLPEFLTEGGLGHVLVEWVHRADEHWALSPRRWVEGSGCDALILHYASSDPLTYAGIWNAELRGDPAAFESALDRWVDYDRRLGIERIAWGGVVLRRRAGRNWAKAISPGASRIGPASEHVERLLAAQDFLASLNAEKGLLDGVFALPDDHRFDQTFTLSGGEGVLERSALRLEGGLRTECQLDPFAVRIVALLDGRRPLREVIVEAAAEAPGGPEPDEFAVETLPTVTQLLELGLIVPR